MASLTRMKIGPSTSEFQLARNVAIRAGESAYARPAGKRKHGLGWPAKKPRNQKKR